MMTGKHVRKGNELSKPGVDSDPYKVGDGFRARHSADHTVWTLTAWAPRADSPYGGRLNNNRTGEDRIVELIRDRHDLELHWTHVKEATEKGVPCSSCANECARDIY